jgi:hypothetical protein
VAGGASEEPSKRLLVVDCEQHAISVATKSPNVNAICSYIVVYRSIRSIEVGN